MEFRRLGDYPRFHLSIGLLIGVLASGLLFLLPAESFSLLFQVLALAQASLLAIIVSVGLLSVQIAANQFTPLIGRRFEEDEFLTGTILLFGGSIALDLVAMLVIPVLNPLAGPLPTIVLFALVIGGVSTATLSFLSLIDIKDAMLDYLNPETLLDDLVRDVSFEAYRDFSEERQENGHTARSPVLEIFQIGQRAFDDNDNHTAIYALHTLSEASQKILSEYGELGEEERQEVNFYRRDVFDYWERLIDSAVEQGTDKTLFQIARHQKNIATVAAENGLVSLGTEAAGTLQYLCEQAYDNERLERPYYTHFKPIIEVSIEQDTPGIANSTVIFVKHLAFTLTTEIEPEEERRSSEELRIIDTLFAHIRDTWSMLFQEKSGQIKQGDFRDIHNRFENEVSHYIATCSVGNRPYPSNLEQDLVAIAESAAENDEQWAVSRLTRMIIELWVVTGRQENRSVNRLARVIDSGGQEGVEEAFEYVLSYDYVEDEDLEPVVFGEDGWKEKMDYRDSKIYNNVIEDIIRLNSVPDFKEQVDEMKEQVEHRYRKHFDEST